MLVGAALPEGVKKDFIDDRYQPPAILKRNIGCCEEMKDPGYRAIDFGLRVTRKIYVQF